LQVIEGGREGEDEIRSRERILGEAAIDRVSSECGRVAKIFQVFLTVPAGPIDSTDPGHAYAGPNGELFRGPINDLAHDLMTWDEVFAARWQFTFYDMQISPANTTSSHTQQNVSWREFRAGDLDDPKGASQNILRGIKDCGFHLDTRFEAASLPWIRFVPHKLARRLC
jgi:hypothetical protein